MSRARKEPLCSPSRFACSGSSTSERAGYRPRQRRLALIAFASLAIAGAVLGGAPAQAEVPRVPSRVFLNGIATPVYFNDGDSFEVLAGELKGTKARLSGYNSLESFGPVHRWGAWTGKELYTYAKLAQLNARRGVWNCESDLSRDTYGRILWFCLDLAVDQVRKGLAHAMSVDEQPGVPEIVAAQQDAIRNKRGIWAHGAPAFVITSAHSADEGGGKDGKTYNRLVSTADGHSASYRHNDNYAVCDWVCGNERPIPAGSAEKAVTALLAHPTAGPIARQMEGSLLRIASEFGHLGYFVGVDDSAAESALTAALSEFDAQGGFGDAKREPASCFLYVPFEQRFNQARAECLK
jgi:endonuclease YncB( thermonuclease family)